MPLSGNAERTVLTLTAEQSAAKVIELRNADGISLGLLIHESGASHFFTPRQWVEVQTRAQSLPADGKTSAEIFAAVCQRMEGPAKDEC